MLETLYKIVLGSELTVQPFDHHRRGNPSLGIGRTGKKYVPSAARPEGFEQQIRSERPWQIGHDVSLTGKGKAATGDVISIAF